MTADELKQEIMTLLASSETNKISGEELRRVLLDIVDSIGENSTFGGTADMAGEVPNIEAEYLATAGTYNNFGGLVVDENELALFYYDGGKEVWGKKTLLVASEGGTYVEANPEGDATGTLNKIGIGDNIYEVPEPDLSDLVTNKELSQGLSGKQDTLTFDNEPTTNSNNPVKSGGVKTALDGKAPSTDIQKGALASDVQTSLGKADTAVQSVEVDPNTETGAAGSDASVTNTGTSTNPVLKFTIPRGADGINGQDAVNPFKGWFDSTSKLPANPHVGDYAYVESSGTTYVYRCATEGQWPQSSSEEKEPSDATFATAQLLNNTKIDDTHLANPIGSDEDNNPTLVKAEDVMQLKAKLAGVTASETKATPTIVSGYKFENGVIASSTNESIAIVNVEGCKRVRFREFIVSSSTTYGYGFYDVTSPISSDTPISTQNYDAGGSSGYWYKEYLVDVPANAKSLVLMYKKSSYSSNDTGFYCYTETGETVAETIDNLDKKTFGYDTEVVSNRIITSFSDNSELKFYGGQTTDLDGSVIVKSSSNFSYTTDLIQNYKGGTLKITKGNSDCRFIIAKKRIPNGNYTLGDLVDGDYLSEYHNNNGQWFAPKAIGQSSSPLTLIVPDDAYRIYFCIRDSLTSYIRTPSSIEFNKTNVVHTDGKFDEVEQEINEIEQEINEIESKINTLPKSCPITFVKGNLAQTIGEEVTIVEDDKRLVSSPINLSTGFYIEPSEEYGIERVLLYDKNDILVSDRELYTTTFVVGVKSWGTMQITPNYSVRIVFRRPDGKNVSVNDNVVKTFVLMNDSRFAMVIPEKYNEFRSRLMEIGNIVWTPIKNVVGAFGSTSWYKKDETVRGLNYSEPSEFSHYVGQHVSVRTFLAALKNPWSVLYTENIAANKNVSKYGYTYSGFADLSAAFYGTVCTGLTSYVANYPSILTSAQWNSNEVTLYAKGNHTHPYGWLVDGQNTGYDLSRDLEGNEDWIKQLNPMDFVWNTGHCSVISDVFVDKFDDDNRFLVWAEQTAPRTRMQVFSAKRFIDRLVSIANSETDDSTPQNPQYKEWAIYKLKYNQRNKITKIKKDDFVQMSFTDFEPKDVIVDEEIMVFKGDYCAVGKDITDSGESWDSDLNDYKLYLNVKRGTKYTSVEIYDEDAVIGTDFPVKTLDITNSDTDNALDTALANSLYGDNEEGWVLVNVANQNLNEGKYKARAVATGVNSGFCHFEIVDINFDVEHISGYDYRCTFGSTEGTPYFLRQERMDGFSTKYIEISSSDVENGYLTFRVSDTSFNTYRYIKLFVKGEYGTVVKRIDVYNLP